MYQIRDETLRNYVDNAVLISIYWLAIIFIYHAI